MNSLKKFFVRIFVSLAFICSAAAFANSFDYIHQGEYAYYLDTRGGNSFFRGYLVFHMDDGTTSVFTRVLDLKTKEDVSFVFVVADGGEEQKGMPYIADARGVPEGKPLVSQSILDFMNFHIMYLGSKDQIAYNTSINDKWDGYTQIFHFNKVLPMFRFSSITYDNYKNSSYTLNRAGILEQKQSKMFFGMMPQLFKHPSNNSNYSVPSASKKDVKLSNHTISLDENWTVSKNDKKVDICKLGVISNLDAQIIFRPENLSSVKLKDETLRALILGSSENLDFSSVNVSKDGSAVSVSYTIFNEVSKVYNYTCLKAFDDGILNLTTFDFAYKAQKQYFNNILNSVK